jgi:hypothetical protein
MASSLITALTVTTPRATPAPTPVTDGEQNGLLNALTEVPDPRDPRGVRYPLSAVLAVAVCAVMAGASSFAAITDWLHELDEHVRIRLGFSDGVPAGTTMRWLLIRLDPTLPTAILAGWLHTWTRSPGPPGPRRYRRLIAVDGKTLRVGPPGRRPSGPSAVRLDTATGIVLPQVAVDTKSNAITSFARCSTRLRRCSAPSTECCSPPTRCTPDRARRRGHRPPSALARLDERNQPALFKQLKRLPWARVPVSGRETAYLTVSLPAGHATAVICRCPTTQ